MEKWIGDIVGKMHIHKVSQIDLAEKLGIRRDYLSKILNGSEKPTNAKERITNALDEIIAAKKN